MKHNVLAQEESTVNVSRAAKPEARIHATTGATQDGLAHAKTKTKQKDPIVTKLNFCPDDNDYDAKRR